jgi:hypothetical protein
MAAAAPIPADSGLVDAEANQPSLPMSPRMPNALIAATSDRGSRSTVFANSARRSASFAAR